MNWNWRLQISWCVMALMAVAIASRFTRDDRAIVQPSRENHQPFHQNIAKQVTRVGANWNDTTARFPQAIKVLFTPGETGFVSRFSVRGTLSILRAANSQWSRLSIVDGSVPRTRLGRGTSTAI